MVCSAGVGARVVTFACLDAVHAPLLADVEGQSLGELGKVRAHVVVADASRLEGVL